MTRALIVFITLITLFCGCTRSKNVPSSDKTAIERVLAKDRQISDETIGILSPDATRSIFSAAVSQYTAKASKQKIDDCPSDFQVAYKWHLKAWQDSRSSIDAIPDGFFDRMVDGAWNTVLRGEADGGWGRLSADVMQAHQKIRDTWMEVEKAAAKYGVAPTIDSM